MTSCDWVELVFEDRSSKKHDYNTTIHRVALRDGTNKR